MRLALACSRRRTACRHCLWRAPPPTGDCCLWAPDRSYHHPWPILSCALVLEPPVGHTLTPRHCSLTICTTTITSSQHAPQPQRHRISPSLRMHHHVPHTPTYRPSVWPLDLPVMMPRVSLGTCCGSSPKVGLGPWLTAGGVGIDTALVRAASSHCTPTHCYCESMLGLDSIMQVLHQLQWTADTHGPFFSRSRLCHSFFC